jgi:signal transduction histidine kinase
VTSATLIVLLFVVAVPASFHYLTTVCTHGACSGPQLTSAQARELGRAGISVDVYAAAILADEILFAMISFGIAALIVWRKPAERIALFGGLTLLAFGAAFPDTLSALATLHPAVTPLVESVDFVGKSCFLVFFYLFPDGRFRPRWGRWVVLLVLMGQILQSFAGQSHPSAVLYVWFLVALGGPLAAQIYRYRRVSGSLQRQQTKWVVGGLMVAIVGFLGVIFVPLVLQPGAQHSVVSNWVAITAIYWCTLLIPLSIGIAILRYRLWDIDLIINRALVYGALSANVVGLYVLMVGGLGALFQARSNLLLSLVATGVVAVLFQPLRERLQRGANRLMYGQRDEPYAVISRLGQQLEGTLAPDAVLSAIIETVAQALKLPYVAIALRGDDEFIVAAAVGAPVGDALVLPLLYQSEPVGQLILGPRPGEAAFSPADRRLLDDLARQAGVAVYAVRLTADLQRSRERLVTTREEERRRLRRDLHDGLGPALAAMAMQSEAARDLLTSNPEQADALLSDLTEQLQAATADIRRLVHELRPPALDDLGLIGALRNQISRYEQGRVRITLDAPESLPALPAAIEVAAYRIVLEALNNVVRHAEAGTCCVRLSLDERASLLCIEISDDGRGLLAGRQAGVGLSSMRERAAELGGTCTIGPRDAGGTRVHAALPVTLDGHQSPGSSSTVR